ncbi:hypothetical protein HDV06_004205 [Boothiomyces sp. JEL0866]|nr:hypothetical protein HDV06_004205 [Boothiomyces sp. JEL0866]
MNSDKQPHGDVTNPLAHLKDLQTNDTVTDTHHGVTFSPSDAKKEKGDSNLNQDIGSKINEGLKAAIGKTESNASSIVHAINPLNYISKDEEERKVHSSERLPMDETLNLITQYSGTTFEDVKRKNEDKEGTTSTAESTASALNPLNYLPEMKSGTREQKAGQLQEDANTNPTMYEKLKETADNIKEGYQSAKDFVSGTYDSATETTSNASNKLNGNYQAAKDKTAQFKDDFAGNMKQGYDQTKENPNQLSGEAKDELNEGYRKTKEESSRAAQDQSKDSLDTVKDKTIDTTDEIKHNVKEGNENSPDRTSTLKRSDSAKEMQDAKDKTLSSSMTGDSKDNDIHASYTKSPDNETIHAEKNPHQEKSSLNPFNYI